MKKKDSKLVAWRLSKLARQTVDDVARETGLSKSQVVEFSIAKYALELPGTADEAKKRLVEFVASKLR